MQSPPARSLLGSIHQRNDLSCSDCHNPHGSNQGEPVGRTHSVSMPTVSWEYDSSERFVNATIDRHRNDA
jgi:formate-dependent nitrite reductase cytochrome c552 subunit